MKLRTQHGGQRAFDIIVAADVIYFERSHKVLLETLITMGHRDTVYYLAFQKRFSLKGLSFRAAPKAGFKFEEVWSGDGVGMKSWHCENGVPP